MYGTKYLFKNPFIKLISKNQVRSRIRIHGSVWTRTGDFNWRDKYQVQFHEIFISGLSQVRLGIASLVLNLFLENKFIEIMSIIFYFLGLKTRKVHGKLILQQNNTVVQCKQFGINVKSMDIKILFSNTNVACTKICRKSTYTYIQYVQKNTAAKHCNVFTVVLCNWNNTKFLCVIFFVICLLQCTVQPAGEGLVPPP